MIFGFSLCAIPLLAALVTYFGMELGDLTGRELLECGDVCCHQH